MSRFDSEIQKAILSDSQAAKSLRFVLTNGAVMPRFLSPLRSLLADLLSDGLPDNIFCSDEHKIEVLDLAKKIFENVSPTEDPIIFGQIFLLENIGQFGYIKAY